MTTEKKLLSAFSKAFYRQVPIDDIAGWKAEDLNAIAVSMCSWAAVRKPGAQKVRVFTPEKKRDGWQAAHTVIQMINDDMPFLVDSITADIAAQGLAIEALFHPILRVRRGKDGRLADVGDQKDTTFLVESHIHIQLEQILTDDAAKELCERLDAVLDDVRDATRDWKAMKASLDETISELAAAPVAADELREARDFLQYLQLNNFTFLGYGAFEFSGSNGRTRSEKASGRRLGLLRRHDVSCFGQGAGSPEAVALHKSASPILISKLVDQYSTVHRRVPVDAVGVKMFDKKGNLVGMHLFIGLFTSSTYSCRTGEVPIVRRKVLEIIRRAGFPSGTHDRAALEHILEKMPRDELFQMTENELHTTALGILRLQTKRRVAFFTHADPLQQYVSCLVYVPRDRYTVRFRMTAGKILEEAVGGQCINFFTNLDDSPVARILFTIRLTHRPGLAFDHHETEQKLIEAGRDWDEKLKQVLFVAHGKKRGMDLSLIYGRAFTSAYHESIDISNAVHDIHRLEELRASDRPIRVDLYRLQSESENSARLKVYHKGSPVPLSDILPMLENMGLRCMAEMPYEVRPHGGDGSSIWIHDFALEGAAGVNIDAVKMNFEKTFLEVWSGRIESDALNSLVLTANLTWEDALVLRAYNRFMRQGRFPFSTTYIEQVLGMYPQIARALIDLFRERHDPHLKMPVEKRGLAIAERLTEKLQDVQKRDHDQILRGMKTLMENTLRTNFFQRDAGGHMRPALAFKLDSKNIPDLPLPRPHVEIFVYSTRVEAVHLRGGEIARGGLRWSDRHDDFRTEILGLLKSQMVKNSVIVPVGAKGGFVVKQPPKTGGREAFQQEGVACYKIFIGTLLDITDNNVKGKIVRPANVVCHDGIDPYLVVAADKGTATFSNIANEISMKAGFWMQDAFASGGSTGYDHKEIGITARGGWESVKRHFREIGKDIQTEPFTVAGVGDMAGDVFGNAMLLSRQIRLLGAFNHVHIFCDPDPDPAVSFAERERMFKARLGWDGYDKALLSPGAMVYERSAKSLKLTPQIKKCFGLTRDTVTPDELMTAILKAEVELMWFGGIGTYVKSATQSHADADDKANDSVRIDGAELRAQVIGEGANLGMTQLGRVEYAQHGGRLNTDFIDNSAGVDCSDHEVNIKILLTDVVGKRKMTMPQRNKLMEKMTDDVAALVLRDNYQQTQALSLQLHRAKENLGLHADFMRDLEKSGLIRRRLEGLPDDETIARRARDGQGLTRPELSILLSYAKMTLFTRIMETDVPDDPAMEELLFDYFPKVLHKYSAEIRNHKLKRGIIATQIVNALVNRMGPVFVQSRIRKTGASEADVIRAYMVVSGVFGLPALLDTVEGLDNKVPFQAQMAAFYEISQVIKRAVTWFLRFGPDRLRVKEDIAAYGPGVETLRKDLKNVVPPGMEERLTRSIARFTDKGMPKDIAEKIAVMNLLSSANDIIDISRREKIAIRDVAVAYFLTGEKLGLDWLRRQAGQLVPSNDWQARVVSGLTDDFFSQQAGLTLCILGSGKKASKDPLKLVEAWFDHNSDIVAKTKEMVEELTHLKAVDLDMLTLVSQRIGQLVHQARS